MQPDDILLPEHAHVLPPAPDFILQERGPSALTTVPGTDADDVFPVAVSTPVEFETVPQTRGAIIHASGFVLWVRDGRVFLDESVNVAGLLGARRDDRAWLTDARRILQRDTVGRIHLDRMSLLAEFPSVEAGLEAIEGLIATM